jgi:hypothetical protein
MLRKKPKAGQDAQKSEIEEESVAVQLAATDDLDQNSFELDDEPDEVCKDVSARRLSSLAGYLLTQLYSSKLHLNLDKLKPAATQHEEKILRTVFDVLLPFMWRKGDPNHKKLHLLSLGNELLRITNNSKFTMELSPMVSLGTLHALPVDAAIVHDMFGDRVEMPSTTSADARRKKNGVFAAVGWTCPRSMPFVPRMVPSLTST